MTSEVKLAALAMMAAVTTLACGGGDPPQSRSPGAPPVPVRLADVQRVAGGSDTLVAGTVRARESATLSARVVASVVDRPVSEGDVVDAGAVVLRLDDAAVRAAVVAAEAQLVLARTEKDRMGLLLGKGAATAREHDEAVARAASASANVATARNQLAYTTLRAPFAGLVSACHVDRGDVVAPGQPLVDIEKGGALEIRADVSAGEAASLSPGEMLPAFVDGIEQPVEARVRIIAAAGDPMTHRFDIRADLPPLPGLRSGLFARLRLPARAAAGSAGLSGTAPDQGRLFVPASALIARGGLDGVFVIEDEIARLRWVAAGARDHGRVEIRAGVKEGERVALDPASLADGVAVRELPGAPAEP